jgi:hypothetical protein
MRADPETAWIFSPLLKKADILPYLPAGRAARDTDTGKMR